MKIDIITIFPSLFDNIFSESMIKIARQKGIANIAVHDLRDWTYDKHRSVDDKPYGGGPGMIMKVGPIDRAVEELRAAADSDVSPVVILMTPQGKRYNQQVARMLSKLDHMIIICGRYEGFDERIRHLVDMEISTGDYILTCGEIPAMIICDSVIRLLPGVLGDEESITEESFENGMLEYPQYTRPSVYKQMSVPDILMSGDSKRIKAWQREQAISRTREKRPDLLQS